MPLEQQQHKSKAEENEFIAGELNESVEIDDINEWVVTVYFYSALHHVERKLAQQNIDSGNHVERNRNIKDHISSRSLYLNYKELKDWSEQARYDCWEADDDHVTWCKDNLEIIKSELGFSS
ncbi:hypothetical protein ACFQMM_03480 [Saliphagus sp. GCM10025308]